MMQTKTSRDLVAFVRCQPFLVDTCMVDAVLGDCPLYACGMKEHPYTAAEATLGWPEDVLLHALATRPVKM